MSSGDKLALRPDDSGVTYRLNRYLFCVTAACADLSAAVSYAAIKMWYLSQPAFEPPGAQDIAQPTCHSRVKTGK